MNTTQPHRPAAIGCGIPAGVTPAAAVSHFPPVVAVARKAVAGWSVAALLGCSGAILIAADAPAEAPSSPPVAPAAAPSPTSGPKEKTEAERRNEALERLARGDVGDPGQTGSGDDSRPRNQEPRVIHAVPAEYPKEMAGTGLSAEVLLTVMVDRMGRASHVRVEDSSDPLFTDAALDAINQWTFSPRIREGKISNAPMRITVPVSEEIGDRPVHDYPGGRIAIENVKYDEEPDTPVRRILGLRPVYPFELLAERKAGEVVIEFVVGDGGRPREFRIVEATHREFGYACQGALVQWRFTPAEKAQRPVNARLRYRLSFQPDELPDALVNLAHELHAGHGGGLETSRTINQQPRVARGDNPVSYDGTGGAPRRRRVTVEIVVTETGEVRLPRAVTAPDPLSGYIALAAVGYWRFEPARKAGQAVPVLVSLPITF